MARSIVGESTEFPRCDESKAREIRMSVSFFWASEELGREAVDAEVAWRNREKRPKSVSWQFVGSAGLARIRNRADFVVGFLRFLKFVVRKSGLLCLHMLCLRQL